MGFIGGMLGLGGGGSGSGYEAPKLANISNPVNAQQIAGADTGVQQAMQGQQGLLQALQGQGGIGNQSQVYNQLQGVASGQGPNPAQAMLNNATGQNVANQAALMASQRGAGANPALMARQAAMQGANTQQQAVGQGAAMQANQSLNALGAAGNMANQQVANQMGANQSNVAAQQAYQQNLLNAQGNFNNAQVGNQGSVNSGNTQLIGNVQKQQQDFVGGIMNGAGKILGMAYEGGEAVSGPQSALGRHMQSFAQGGAVKAKVSPGETIVPPEVMKSKGAKGAAEYVAAGKGKVPGKPKMKGNHQENDTVPANLKTGAFVIPNSVMQSKDPVRGAAEFVRAHMSKKGK